MTLGIGVIGTGAIGRDHSAQVIVRRKTRNASGHLADPQIVMQETAIGVRIDIEIFMNCKYGTDVQCEVAAEDRAAYLSEPPGVPTRQAARVGRPLQFDWKQRFIEGYDVDLQAFIDAVAQASVAGPSSWDGYVAADTSDACVADQDRIGETQPINLPTRPALSAA